MGNEDNAGDELEPIDGPGPQLEALGDHVILELDGTEEDRTPSGLVVPASASPPKHGYRRFRVLAAGPLCSEDRLSEIPEPDLQPGDLVLAPVGELGVYREGGQTYYITQYELLAAVLRDG